MDEEHLFSVGGTHALLDHLPVSFDAPPAVKLSRATSELHACTRGNGTVAAYVVKFRTAATRCASAGAPRPDTYIGGLLLCNVSLSHEQQVVVQVTAAASAQDPASPSVGELAAALDRHHSHSPPPPSANAVATITLTAAQHAALIASGGDREPIVCWQCHKEGHVRFICPERQQQHGAPRPPTPSLPRPAAAVAGPARPAAARPAAARPVLIATVVSRHASTAAPGGILMERASAQVLRAASSVVGDAIIDPGAIATVSGKAWLQEYVLALPDDLRSSVITAPAAVLFRFGDGWTTLADEHWTIPIELGGVVRKIGTSVIPGHLPLLMSRPALRAARAVLDMEDNTMWLKDLGTLISLAVVDTGHLTVNLLPQPHHSALAAATQRRRRCVTFSAPGDAPSADPVVTPAVEAVGESPPSEGTDPPAQATGAADNDMGPSFAAHQGIHRRDSLAVPKVGPRLTAVLTRLHCSYGHPCADRLTLLLKEAGCTSRAVSETVQRLTAACKACRTARPRPPRALVTIPRPTHFNDSVAIDLAEIAGRGSFLHVIDLGTRLSRCVAVSDKEAPTRGRALLSQWINVYGACRVILSDPGRELHNALMRLLAERFNMRVDVTAGQSAWSNGVCERHNGVVKHMVISWRPTTPPRRYKSCWTMAVSP